jgi:hypothetical protein
MDRMVGGCSFAMTVSISARNMLKTVHAFFGAAADVSAPVSLQVVERMASLSSRYAMFCTHMLPFTSALHGAKKGRIMDLTRC